MKLGWFETIELIPDLKNVHAFAIIPDWLNYGGSAGLALKALEKQVDAELLARLPKPGEFFDFTRYRPQISIRENDVSLEVPNAVISFGKSQVNDFLFLHLPEPHAQAEDYVESVVELLKHFEVKRYSTLGSFAEMVPPTRPLLVTGRASNQRLQNAIEAASVFQESYQGPTSILRLIAKQAEEAGLETLNLNVHLQSFFQINDDHRGEVRLLEVIKELYGIPVPQADIDEAAKEAMQIATMSEKFLKEHPQLRPILTQLENNYDARVSKGEQTKLSPEIEQFLQKMSQRFEAG